MDLKTASTKDLVEELKQREEVDVKRVDPYEDYCAEVNGPAVVLIVID
jgi:general stress protein 26